jgi:hypothetical protein
MESAKRLWMARCSGQKGQTGGVHRKTAWRFMRTPLNYASNWGKKETPPGITDRVMLRHSLKEVH